MWYTENHVKGERNLKSMIATMTQFTFLTNMPIKIRVIDKINIFIWNRTMLHYRRWTLIYVNVLVRRLTECDIKMLVLFWTHWKILWSKFPNMNLRYIPHWNVYQGQFWNIDEHFFFFTNERKYAITINNCEVFKPCVE